MTIINTRLNVGSGKAIVRKEPILNTNLNPCQNLLSESKMGSGADSSINVLPEGNDVEIGSLFEGTFADTDLPEVQPTTYVVEGFEGTNWFVNDGTQQIYGNFPKGSITDFPRSMTVVVEPQKIYIYPYTNNEYVNGCLVNYTDVGTQKTFKVYVVYNDDRESAFLLVDGDITSGLIPTGFTYYAYIKEVTVPAHTVFTLKPYNYEVWEQPNIIADNAYGNITAISTYNSDYKAFKATKNSNTCWVVQNGYVGNTWWRWEFPEKLLVKSIYSRGRDNGELFADSCWYSDNTKTEPLCEAYLQSTSDLVNCGYKELSEIYFTGYDGPSSGNPGLRNLLITAVKGEHVWVAPEMEYNYVNPSNSILYYNFSNFTNNNVVIDARKKVFFERGYEAATFPKTISKEHFTNSGCTKNGTVFTGGQNKCITLDKLIDLYKANSWEIVVDYTYNGGGSEKPIISLGPGGVDYTNLQIMVNDYDEVKLFGSSNNTSWDIFEGTSTDLTLSSNTEYLFKFTYDSTTGYQLQYSTDDGTSWTSCFTSATTTKIRCLKPFNLLGNGYNNNSYYSNGSTDMSKNYIKVNNQFAWQPYESYTTYVSDGCLVNYVDDGSATTLKAYLVTFTNGDKDIVLSPDNTFTITGATDKTYLKDVTVPEHSLYGYVDMKGPWAGQPILTSNGTPGGSTFAAWASSEGSVWDDWSGEEKQTKAYYAFDGMTDTSGYPFSPSNTWVASGSNDQWLAFYSPDPLFMQSITITNPSFYQEYDWMEGYKFSKGKVQASTDNSTWVDLTGEFTNSGSSQGTYTVDVNSETSYHYFRLYHTTSNSSPGISELALNALSIQKGFVKKSMSYSIIQQTDRPNDIKFDTFAFGNNDVFYEKTKIIADFNYKDPSATKSDAVLVNYTDTGVAVTLNAYVIDYSDGYRDIVLSPDNTFSITGVTTKTLVGTVDIPAHTVYTYASTHQQFTLSSPFSGLSTHNDFVDATTLVDNQKLRVNGNYIEITDSQKYDGVSVQSYMTVNGSSDISVSVTCYANSEGNYDWGYVYMGTQLYQPSTEDCRNRTTDGHGDFIYVGSGEWDAQTYNYTAPAGSYYLIIGYTKDGSASEGDDTIKVSNISLEANSAAWTPVS